jgi:cell division protein FtsI (penicillin-binding protein 3)
VNEIPRRRVYLVLVAFVVFMGSIGVRLVSFQVIRGADLGASAREERSSDRPVPARRGTIYDRNGNVLASTIPLDRVEVDLSQIQPEDDAVLARALAGPLQMSADDIAQRFHDTRAARAYWVQLRRHLSPAQSDGVRALKLGCMNAPSPCVLLTPEPQRVYPNGDFAAQVIGFANWDLEGAYGVERSYNAQIGGQPGRMRAEYDVHGNLIAVGQQHLDPPVDGLDVTLTLDAGIQRLVERQLEMAIDSQHAAGGSAIVMDVNTGAIVAMADRPSFDPNTFESFDLSTFKNTAVSGLYEPGSTFKILTMAIGLQTGAITPDSIFYDAPGYIKVDDFTITNLGGATYGHETMSEILQHSSNLGAAWIAQKVGPEGFYNMLRQLNFGTGTGVDLPGEEAGIVNWSDAPDWRPITLMTNGFGQGISVTPIEMLTAVSAVANGGKLMRPYIVQDLRHDGQVVHTNPPQVVRQVFSPEVSREVVGMLTEVVDNVSYPYVGVPGYAIGAKSGTAQIPAAGGGYEPDDHTIGSMIGIGPSENPRYAVLVRIDRPKKDPLGAHIAGPPVAQILLDLFNAYGIPPTRKVTEQR